MGADAPCGNELEEKGHCRYESRGVAGDDGFEASSWHCTNGGVAKGQEKPVQRLGSTVR
jgi:hypothetical protein